MTVRPDRPPAPRARARATVRTPRTVGHRLGPTDLADFQAFYADPEVMATLSEDGTVWSKSEAAELFQKHLEHWETHGFGTWMFRDPADGAFVGRAGLRSVDVGRGAEVEVFYGIDPEMWGRGLATEIARAIIAVAFDDLDLDGLVGFTLPTNHRSQRVMEKCGYQRDGEFIHAGLQHLLYRLDRARWDSIRTS